MDIKNDTVENLRIQLVELNNRSRWYSSQLWQIPFVYIGSSGIFIGGIEDGSTTDWFFVSFSIAIIGLFVIGHMRGVADGEKRAVENLEKIERALGLDVTAEYKEKYTQPLQSLVILVFLISSVSTAVLFFMLDG